MPITITKTQVYKYDSLTDFLKYSGLNLKFLRKLFDEKTVLHGNEYVKLYDIFDMTDTEIAEVEGITRMGTTAARKALIKKLKKKLKERGYEQSKD